ncbi:hypothetical protein TNCV_1953001 [Trichonephila clavipes]|nr:hypothetical protein TNCV_1953001 [Trichonephila clavipes]
MGSGHHSYLVVSFVLTRKYAPYGRFLKGGFGNAICDRGSQAVKVKSTNIKCLPVGRVWYLREGVPAQVSSSCLDHGSKFPDSLPKALEKLNRAI